MKTETLEKIAIDAIHELKGTDLTRIDVKELTSIADTFLIVTGRSSRHVTSIAENIVIEAKKHKVDYIRTEGQREGEWVIVDLGDVVVHVMQATTRAFYSLEDLWETHALARNRDRK